MVQQVRGTHLQLFQGAQITMKITLTLFKL